MMEANEQEDEAYFRARIGEKRNSMMVAKS